MLSLLANHMRSQYAWLEVYLIAAYLHISLIGFPLLPACRLLQNNTPLHSAYFPYKYRIG